MLFIVQGPAAFSTPGQSGQIGLKRVGLSHSPLLFYQGSSEAPKSQHRAFDKLKEKSIQPV